MSINDRLTDFLERVFCPKRSAERARMEDCAMAERTFGASALQKRPECRDLIAPSLSASVVAP